MLRAFLKTLKDEWLRYLAFAIIGGTVVLITISWKEINKWYVDKQNISNEDAIVFARLVVGAKTIHAIPFRNVDSDEQYIAVIAKDYEEEEYLKYGILQEVYILTGQGRTYEKYNTGLKEALLALDIEDIFGVIDVDEDGNKEVYVVFGAAGSGGYGFVIKVYDSINRMIYELEGGRMYADPVLEIEISPNSSQKEGLVSWLREKANEIDSDIYGEKDKTDWYDEARMDWFESNGTGFYYGKLRSQKFKGKIPPTRATFPCYLDDGEYEWLSFFKGPLFAYDKARDEYFIVYIPKDAYNWVPSMVSGKNYLWIGTVFEDGILAFNKRANSLTVVTFPGIGDLIDVDPPPYEKSVYKSVEEYEKIVESWRPFRETVLIRSDSSNLYISDILINLPDSINVEEEFRNSVYCDRWNLPKTRN